MDNRSAKRRRNRRLRALCRHEHLSMKMAFVTAANHSYNTTGVTEKNGGTRTYWRSRSLHTRESQRDTWTCRFLCSISNSRCRRGQEDGCHQAIDEGLDCLVRDEAQWEVVVYSLRLDGKRARQYSRLMSMGCECAHSLLPQRANAPDTIRSVSRCHRSGNGAVPQ